MNDMILEMESCILKFVNFTEKCKFRDGNDAKDQSPKCYYNHCNTCLLQTKEISRKNGRSQNYSTYILLTRYVIMEYSKQQKIFDTHAIRKRFQLRAKIKM